MSLATARLCAAEPAEPSTAPPRELRVAVAQPLVVPADVQRNIHNMQPLVAEAARRGADVVVFSEAGITGYDLKGRGVAAALDLNSPALKRVDDLARAHRIVIVAGLFERQEGAIRNTAVAFFPDGKRVVQRKHNIMPPEQNMAHTVPAARDRELFEIRGFRCALLICSDAGMPGIFEQLARAGCDATIVITAGAGSDTLGFHLAELRRPETRAKAAAMTALCLAKESIEQALTLDMALVACNQEGWDQATGYFHPGGSSIIDRTGEVTAVIPPRFVFEQQRADLAVGAVSRRK